MRSRSAPSIRIGSMCLRVLLIAERMRATEEHAPRGPFRLLERPPTEPEGEDIEAMMRGVGLSDPPQPEGDILPPGPRGPPGHL